VKSRVPLHWLPPELQPGVVSQVPNEPAVAHDSAVPTQDPEGSSEQPAVVVQRLL
jgi:hypothetical protein